MAEVLPQVPFGISPHHDVDEEDPPMNDMQDLTKRMAVEAAPVECYSDDDRAFFAFWYSHMKNDIMTGSLADVSHSTARYIWDSARVKLVQAVARECAEITEGSSRDDDMPIHIRIFLTRASKEIRARFGLEG